MIEHHIDIDTGEGQMNTFIVHPEEGGPFPVVFVYMDAPGKREELHDMARRIATVGYYVVLPNLYYRRTREFVMVRDEAGFKIMFEHMNALRNEMVIRDTRAMLDYVDAQSATKTAAKASSLGGVGYCMSGPFILAACGAFPDRFNCGASIYGANLITKHADSAHLWADKVRGEMYFACAEIDKYAPKETIDAFEEHLRSTSINYRLEWYLGAEHGFAFPQRAGIFHKPSAERHWERLFSLFDRNLRAR
ncbi:MAG TPA: dienelactone hydrolase family protein [Steroidobacteraceae bacterium]|nr:dienelactone hydrolase family protein [Steroidobacteraceae bacterium]